MILVYSKQVIAISYIFICPFEKLIMAEKEGEKHNAMNVLCPEDTFYIKEEFEDDSCMDNEHFVSETAISANNGQSSNNVWSDSLQQFDFSTVDIKTESLSEVSDSIVHGSAETKCEINVANDIKIEIDEDYELLFCEHCQANYEDYCTTCGMLVRILNRNVLSKADNKVQEEIPQNILQIRDSIAQLGIFALKVIPEGVKFGPFIGLDTAECPWKMKGGRFVESSDKSVLLNWMQYINPAKNTTEQNLLAFLCEDNLYYESNREIQKGEELLVYFGEEYNDNLKIDVEMDFIPATKDDLKDVFACTFCCLGFSSREYLAKHKSTCLYNGNKDLSAEELTQCSFCKIYMDVTEYSEHHMAYCCETNARKHIPLAMDNPPGIYKPKIRRRMSYKSLTSREGNMRTHMKKNHPEEVEYKCHSCKYTTNCKIYLKRHIKTKHPNEFDYECAVCGFKTNQKLCYQNHVKTKHLEEFVYKCASCEFKTNKSSYFQIHVKTKHPEEFDYECASCEFKTNKSSYFQIHMKTKHLEEFAYECASYEFKTNKTSYFQIHKKTKHVEEADYKCASCEYITNNKRDFQTHFETKSLEEFGYKCDLCEFKTNYQKCLEWHGKLKHLNECHVIRMCLKTFSYKCGKCEFKANTETEIKMHMRAKHPQPKDSKLFRHAAPLIDKHLHTPAAPQIRSYTIHPQLEVPKLSRPATSLIYKQLQTPAAPPIRTHTIHPQPEVPKLSRPPTQSIYKHLRTTEAPPIRTHTIHPQPEVPKLCRPAAPLIDKQLRTPAAPPIRPHFRFVSKIVKADFKARTHKL